MSQPSGYSHLLQNLQTSDLKEIQQAAQNCVADILRLQGQKRSVDADTLSNCQSIVAENRRRFDASYPTESAAFWKTVDTLRDDTSKNPL